ncbi:hypothetical protein [Desulfosoma caldarium]|uniref:hypothetical protein n=1 Tax=Desulfosoma caldarium TaxID=610254 RepID=UPI000F484EB9|nr:hypothetical protein [Desulfosoma caldarium]
MHWATLDPFILNDPFWQHRMGMPAANKQFLEALLQYGDCSSYRFFVGDLDPVERLSRFFQGCSAVVAQRIRVELQSVLPLALRKRTADIFHNGDFTYSTPYLMEWRNRL